MHMHMDISLVHLRRQHSSSILDRFHPPTGCYAAAAWPPHSCATHPNRPNRPRPARHDDEGRTWDYSPPPRDF
jgi:hypothetical protein